MKENFKVKEYEFLNPSIDEIYYRVNRVDDDCEDIYFHYFVYNCVFSIKFKNKTNNKEVIFQVTLKYGEYKKFESDDLDVIMKNIENKGFIFSRILKLTMKIYSKFSDKTIKSYLKLRIPIMNRKVLQKSSQNLENVKRFCNDENDFRFGIRQSIDSM